MTCRKLHQLSTTSRLVSLSFSRTDLVERAHLLGWRLLLPIAVSQESKDSAIALNYWIFELDYMDPLVVQGPYKQCSSCCGEYYYNLLGYQGSVFTACAYLYIRLALTGNQGVGYCMRLLWQPHNVLLLQFLIITVLTHWLTRVIFPKA